MPHIHGLFREVCGRNSSTRSLVIKTPETKPERIPIVVVTAKPLIIVVPK
jgi:hypothetical protein